MPDSVEYLMSLDAIRAKCTMVYNLALEDKLTYWSVDVAKLDPIVHDIMGLVDRDYGGDYTKIPPHGRWRHFLGGRLDNLVIDWRKENVNEVDIARRLFDLMVVSVLLDAGAGDTWKFTTPDTGDKVGRSEGLALASFFMFKDGLFSSESTNPFQVDSKGLAALDVDSLKKGLQASDDNPLHGALGRTNLLIRLGSVMSENEKFFGTGIQRPGKAIDYLMSVSKQTPSAVMKSYAINTYDLWNVIIHGLQKVWPTEGRIDYNGVILGDVWPCEALGSDLGANLVPFHKLSQWLTYSLIEIFRNVLGWPVYNMDVMTGLPEYRNGGLITDYNVVALKKDAFSGVASFDDLPPLGAAHPAIVEWRALTVILLDKIGQKVREAANQPGLSLPQILEAGTWKLGREIAAAKRPDTRGPPFKIILDGTVF